MIFLKLRFLSRIVEKGRSSSFVKPVHSRMVVTVMQTFSSIIVGEVHLCLKAASRALLPIVLGMWMIVQCLN